MDGHCTSRAVVSAASRHALRQDKNLQPFPVESLRTRSGLLVFLFCLLFTSTVSAQLPPPVPLTPVIGVDPPVLDFGSVPIGGFLEETINVSNQTIDLASELVVSSIEASGAGYSISDAPPLPVTIPGGTSVPVTIGFSPKSLGPASGTFEVVGNAVNSPKTIRLSGQGILPDGPTSIFAEWQFGADSLSFAPMDTFEVAQLGALTAIVADDERAGLPSLPVLTAQVLLPRDRRIREVVVQAIPEPQGADRHLLYPIQRQGTLDGEPQPEFVPPDPAVYSSPVPYPSTLVEVVHETWHRGYRLATVNVYPLQFVGASTTVILNTRIAATFLLDPLSQVELDQMAPKLRPDYKARFKEHVRKGIARRVVNPGALAAFYGEPTLRGRAYGGFTPSEMPSLDSPPVEYVIVTRDDLVESFQRLADWKTRSGMPAQIRTVSWISERYAGIDQQERIRNFIRDAYSRWGTNYVLLGGDTEVVPERFFHDISIFFQDPPVDYYYAALDGNWNGNGNSEFGEPLNPPIGDGQDLSHEVMVARAPVNTPPEAATFVDKVMTYARAPGTNEITGEHYDSLLLLAGTTNGLRANYLNGIWVAEQIEKPSMPRR